MDHGTEAEDEITINEAYAEALLDHRKRLDEARIDQHSSADKAILTLAPAGLGASLLLLNSFAQRQQIETPLALAIAWGCFLLAIILNVASYHASAIDLAEEIRRLDRDLRSGSAAPSRINPFRLLTNSLNLGVLLAFLIGAVSLFWFAYANTTGMGYEEANRVPEAYRNSDTAVRGR